MPDLWMDVDAALSEVPVNIFPLIDNTDFKSIEADVNYNATGLVLVWHFITCAGAYSQTAVTPTDTGGDYDWVEQGNGIFTIEIPASGGATINNDTEGVGWFTGVATGILPWRGPTIGFRRAALNDLLIEGGTASTNLEDFFDGTGYAGGTAKLTADVVKWNGTAVASPATAGYPAVTLKVGTGTGEVNLTTGKAPATIAAGDLAADSITASALKADAATEIADALLTRDMSAVTGEAARSPLNALRAIRNKVAISGTTMSVKKEDDSTEAWSAALTTDASANPITAIDPA